MKDGTLFKTGLACTCTAALCCFTPILVLTLGAIGLSAAVGWLDYVLLPALSMSILVTIYAALRLMKRRQHARTTLDRDLS